jgi:EpsI family protein
MLKPYRLLAANLVLALALVGSVWGRRAESASAPAADTLQRLALPFRNWKTVDTPLSPDEDRILQPDAVLARRYVSPEGESAELVVIAGHRKRTVHTPGYCMVGGGWEVISQHGTALPLPEGAAPATQSVMSNEGREMIATYLFTDGVYATPNVVQLQWRSLLKRMRGQLPLAALVRIIVPVTRNREAAVRLTDDFARATLPGVFEALRRAGRSDSGLAGS